VAKTDLSSLLPFALIAPEANKRRARPVSTDSAALTISGSQEPSEEGTTSSEAVPQTPASVYSSRNFSFLQGPPRDLKGVFIRKFRWGTVDVLDPNHCDFAALRTAVLSTHLKVSPPFFHCFKCSPDHSKPALESPYQRSSVRKVQNGEASCTTGYSPHFRRRKATTFGRFIISLSSGPVIITHALNTSFQI
jgi:hypothetical protein